MITIQSVMLVALGFLAASLLALLFAPIYRGRTVRLTTRRLRQTVPLTEDEIRADKDRIRTQYALRVHELESELEKARLAAARQRIELNRREAVISGLEGQVSSLKSDLEQHVNARRVLEQTVTERVPAIEQRLAETRALLHQRDQELAMVSADTGKTVRALDEAMQINAQQRVELDRLSGAAALRARDGRRQTANPTTGEIDGSASAEGSDELALIANGSGNAGSTDKDSREDLGAKITGLNVTIEQQASRIRQLEAALKAYEEGEDNRISLKGSKLAMKARISSLQTEVVSQADTIHKLRVELASANERLALQSVQYMEEMRRLGAGTLPASAPSRRHGSGTAPRRALIDRMADAPPSFARPKDISPPAGETKASGNGTAKSNGDGDSKAAGSDNAKMIGNGGAPTSSSGEAGTPPAAEATQPPAEIEAAAAEPAQSATASEKAPEAKPKARLMDRIAGLTER